MRIGRRSPLHAHERTRKSRPEEEGGEKRPSNARKEEGRADRRPLWLPSKKEGGGGGDLSLSQGSLLTTTPLHYYKTQGLRQALPLRRLMKKGPTESREKSNTANSARIGRLPVPYRTCMMAGGKEEERGGKNCSPF